MATCTVKYLDSQVSNLHRILRANIKCKNCKCYWYRRKMHRNFEYRKRLYIEHPACSAAPVAEVVEIRTVKNNLMMQSWIRIEQRLTSLTIVHSACIEILVRLFQIKLWTAKAHFSRIASARIHRWLCNSCTFLTLGILTPVFNFVPFRTSRWSLHVTRNDAFQVNYRTFTKPDGAIWHRFFLFVPLLLISASLWMCVTLLS
jgi:hypothetical protein